MVDSIYTFRFLPNWMLLANEISQLDRFDASWASIEKRESQTLKQLKSIATVRSTGASTRIEGSRMTDDEVSVLVSNLTVSKPEERDQQEVAGYFEVMELISASYRDIEITESNMKHLHNLLMKYSEKDSWHKGNYKQHSNVVEATSSDGTKQTVFKTTEPGIITEQSMADLIQWYQTDNNTLPLIKTALFVYEFLSIHPFQNGNGRLSRLLSNLLLLKMGYSWIQFVSFEHEIEFRKSEYYRVLMQCQRQRPGEDVAPWVLFFLDCLKNIQQQLQQKLQGTVNTTRFSQKQKIIYSFIENHPGSRSGEMAQKLNIPLPTVKRLLSEMVKNKQILSLGAGAGTHYSISETTALKKDSSFIFTARERKKEFTLTSPHSFLEIKKVILKPLFQWTHPDEWSTKLAANGLDLHVVCKSNSSAFVSKSYHLNSYITPYHFQPVIELRQPIHIPESIWDTMPLKKEYPLHISVELLSTADTIDFDVLLVFDEQ